MVMSLLQAFRASCRLLQGQDSAVPAGQTGIAAMSCPSWTFPGLCPCQKPWSRSGVDQEVLICVSITTSSSVRALAGVAAWAGGFMGMDGIKR